MLLRSSFPAVLTVLVALAGCTREAEDGRLPVVVSIPPHAWLVDQVGGPHVRVLTLVQPGESAETYQPSDARISEVLRAKLCFRSGMPFEQRPGFAALASHPSLRMVDLWKEGIALRRMPRHGHAEHDAHDEHGGHHDHGAEACAAHAGGEDPHTWLDPRLLEIQARTVAAALAEVDPAHAAEYDRNAAALAQRLRELDAELANKLKPLEGRAFFVFHPAWGYFAARYGLSEISIEAEGKEPSDRELTELQELARSRKARVVFAQPQSPPKAVRAVADAIGARVETIDDLAYDVPKGLRDLAEALVRSQPGG